MLQRATPFLAFMLLRARACDGGDEAGNGPTGGSGAAVHDPDAGAADGAPGQAEAVPLPEGNVEPGSPEDAPLHAEIRDPGTKRLHRLNRAEYDNTVRDLFGTSLRPARDFPADDYGVGFDNDFYQPDLGQDRNLLVDASWVDGPLDWEPAPNPQRGALYLCDRSSPAAATGLPRRVAT